MLSHRGYFTIKYEEHGILILNQFIHCDVSSLFSPWHACKNAYRQMQKTDRLPHPLAPTHTGFYSVLVFMGYSHDLRRICQRPVMFNDNVQSSYAKNLIVCLRNCQLVRSTPKVCSLQIRNSDKQLHFIWSFFFFSHLHGTVKE